jgi:hypothetical protein
MYRLLLSINLISCVWISADVLGMISEEKINKIYEESGIEEKIDWEIFKLSMIGFNQLQKSNLIEDESILTIIDYSKPSTEERFFVIDLKNKKILYSSLVAHGKNSGWNMANDFSNQSGSLKSSIGFFMTSDTYYGKHGYSLKLKGLESSINDNAEDRAIVIHKARYVSEVFIKKYGRLGRSWGCPALPVKSAGKIIDEIKNGSCLFIYAKNEDYLSNSILVNNKSIGTEN